MHLHFQCFFAENYILVALDLQLTLYDKIVNFAHPPQCKWDFLVRSQTGFVVSAENMHGNWYFALQSFTFGSGTVFLDPKLTLNCKSLTFTIQDWMRNLLAVVHKNKTPFFETEL